MAANIAIIAITTRSSIRVNPRLLRLDARMLPPCGPGPQTQANLFSRLFLPLPRRILRRPPSSQAAEQGCVPRCGIPLFPQAAANLHQGIFEAGAALPSLPKLGGGDEANVPVEKGHI